MSRIIESCDYVVEYQDTEVINFRDSCQIKRHKLFYYDKDHKSLEGSCSMEPIDVINCDMEGVLDDKCTINDIGNLEYNDNIISFIDRSWVHFGGPVDIVRYHVNPIEMLIGVAYVDVFGCSVRVEL